MMTILSGNALEHNELGKGNLIDDSQIMFSSILKISLEPLLQRVLGGAAGGALLERLVASLPRRMEMVIAAKGDAIDR